MHLIKYAASSVLALVLLYAFVVTFSAVESRFQCSGNISFQGISQPATVYIRMAEYRWWVGLWSDSDRALWLEVPNEWVDYFGHLVEAGDQLQIYDADKNMQGSFSTLSRTLTLNTPRGFFDGACKRIERD